MYRVFSGIKPTGEMHIGNYLGAVRRWVDEQDKCDAIYCVVDLHAMTIPYNSEQFRGLTKKLVMLLLASGIDPNRSIFFIQSHVPQHTYLTWLLSCNATYGELKRQTQFKSKEDSQASVSVGLFTYPVLMAADILLYDTDKVPVGEDQKQHVELARDIAIRFNARFGNVFVIPEATLAPVGARIKDLQNPAAKMSKSEESPLGTILMLDTPQDIIKKIKVAKTDSETEIRYDTEQKPGVSNLIEIYSIAKKITIPETEKFFTNLKYGALKEGTAQAVIDMLHPIQLEYSRLERSPEEVEKLMSIGASKAGDFAQKKLKAVCDAVGLIKD